MSNPYINTKLYTQILLRPKLMNNDIYLNLKNELIKTREGRCNRYGFVSKIYDIDEYKNPVISPENMSGAAKFDVKYSCRLCIPLEMTQVVFKVDKLNKRAIAVKNGPIIMFITMDRINEKNFFIDKVDKLRYKTTKEGSEVLKQGNFVKATVQTVQFHENSKQITAIGYLDEMATEIEKIDFFRSQYGDGDTFTDYETYKKHMDDVSDDESDVELDVKSEIDSDVESVDNPKESGMEN
jgi:DNA-directed RNA polymerase subunit E'/Rpb7